MIKIITSLFLLLSVATQAQTKDTFDVLFPLNDARLAKAAKEHIDMLMFKDSLVHGQQFIILGYADYLGSEKYNENLSAMRAKNVKEYLVSAGFKANEISICMGKGKIDRSIPAGKDGIATDRKVQIIIAPQKAPESKPAPATTLDAAHLAVNQTVTLKNILFYGNAATILPSSMPELENLYHFMNTNKKIKIQIEGHVCCKGMGPGNDDETRQSISFDRAKAVYDYLITKGISKDRLTYKGLGATQPAVYPALTDEDQQKNRRVEIRIMQK